MRIHVYPPQRCYHSLSDLLIAPFLSTKNFEKFIQKWLRGKPHLFAYRGRNIIYHILVYLKRNFNVKRVIVPSYICKDAVTPIKAAGLPVVFADNDLKTLGVDFKSIKLKPNDVIIFPNLFGLKARTDRKLLARKKIFIIEDNAQSFFRPSKFADFTMYSFGRGKEISGSEGGLVVVNKKRLYNFFDVTKLVKPNIVIEISRYIEYFLWRIKNYRIIYFLGKSLKSLVLKSKRKISIDVDIEGKNFSMCDISKKIAWLQLQRLGSLRQKSKRLAKIFIESTKSIKSISVMKPPENSNYFCLNFLVENRDSLRSFLERNHIFTSVPWGYLAEDIFNNKSHKKASYILDHVLQFLIDPTYMKKEDILFIVQIMKEWEKQQK